MLRFMLSALLLFCSIAAFSQKKLVVVTENNSAVVINVDDVFRMYDKPGGGAILYLTENATKMEIQDNLGDVVGASCGSFILGTESETSGNTVAGRRIAINKRNINKISPNPRGGCLIQTKDYRRSWGIVEDFFTIATSLPPCIDNSGSGVTTNNLSFVDGVLVSSVEGVSDSVVLDDEGLLISQDITVVDTTFLAGSTIRSVMEKIIEKLADGRTYNDTNTIVWTNNNGVYSADVQVSTAVNNGIQKFGSGLYMSNRADAIVYSNASSGVDVNNVQDALDRALEQNGAFKYGLDSILIGTSTINVVESMLDAMNRIRPELTATEIRELLRTVDGVGSGIDADSLGGLPASAYLDNTDTQLTEAEVDAMVANNGYLLSYTETDPVFLAHLAYQITSADTLRWGIDQFLTEFDVDTYVANNGYLTGNETVTLLGDIVGSGETTITTQIAANAVRAAALNDNAISGLADIASAIVPTDEMMISDGGVLRKADISVLQAYMQANLNFGAGGTGSDGNGLYDASNTGNIAVTQFGLAAGGLNIISNGNPFELDGSTIWTAGNDGSGSGLDAGLLEGQNGAYYLAYANLTGAPTLLSQFTNDAGYITSYTETDPIYSAWDKSSGIVITESQISDLSHTVDTQRSLEEIEDWVGAMVANNTESLITVVYQDADGTLDFTVNPNLSAYTNDVGFLTSYTETDPIFSAWDRSTGIVITESQISDLSHTVDTKLSEAEVDAFVSNNGYLTSYTETDPIFNAWDRTTGIQITESQITDLAHTVDTKLTEEEVEDFIGGMTVGNTESLISVIYRDIDGTLDFTVTPTLSSYTNDAGFLTSYTETDPLFTAWDRSTGIVITESQISDLSHTVNTNLSPEQVEDYVGAMLTGNTESRISVVYQDGDGTIDFTVDGNLSSYVNDVGFLTSFTEVDPLFSAHLSSQITVSDTTRWGIDTNTQLTESQVDGFVSNNGYLTSYTETDPLFTAWDRSSGIVITESQISDLSHTVDTKLSLEEVQDFVGGMFSGNTETGVSAVYQDIDGTIDLFLDVTANWTGTFDGQEGSYYLNYNNLTNKPSIFDGDYNSLTNLPTLFSGEWNDILNKPAFAPANAEQNVQSDWNQTVTSADDFIKNKPTTITTGQAAEIAANTLKRSYPISDENKLAGIESGATADQTASEILTALLTVDGTGTGLDADLLDGLQSSDFTRRISAISTDASKTFTATGFGMEIYGNYGGSTGFPTGAGLTVDFSNGISALSSNWVRDFSLYHNAASDNWYLSGYDSSTGARTAWHQIYHTGNLTPFSGDYNDLSNKAWLPVTGQAGQFYSANSTGRYGINTPSPRGALDVVGDTYLSKNGNVALIVDQLGVYGSGFKWQSFQQLGVDDWHFVGDNTLKRFRIWNSSNESVISLNQDRSIDFNNYGTNDYLHTVGGKVTAGTWPSNFGLWTDDGDGTISRNSRINTTGQIRVDLGTTGNSLILTGSGSNFQINHDATSWLNMFNSGGGIRFRNPSNTASVLEIPTSMASNADYLKTVGTTLTAGTWATAGIDISDIGGSSLIHNSEGVELVAGLDKGYIIGNDQSIRGAVSGGTDVQLLRWTGSGNLIFGRVLGTAGVSQYTFRVNGVDQFLFNSSGITAYYLGNSDYLRTVNGVLTAGTWPSNFGLWEDFGSIIRRQSKVAIVSEDLALDIRSIASGSIASPSYPTLQFSNQSGAYRVAQIQGIGRAANVVYGGLRFRVASDVVAPTWIDAMIIEGNGNVGIGTITPAKRLDISAPQDDGIRIVAGNAFIGAGATGGDAQLMYWNGSTVFFGRSVLGGSVQSYDFRTDGLPRVVIQQNGNVGIGTTFPTALMHINTNQSTSNFLLETTHPSGISLLQMKGAASASVRYLNESGVLQSRIDMVDAGQFNFVDEAGNIDVIFKNGNVGIGTTSPFSKMHLGLEADHITVGNLVSGNSHFGSMGMGAPTNGLQDYGSYISHNAYRSTDGNWKHSRTSTIGAARFTVGGGGGNTGLTGFTWSHSTNVGTGNIAWSELMNLSTTGILSVLGNTVLHEGNYQPDWNQTVTTAPDYIENKPILDANVFTPAYTVIQGVNNIQTSRADYFRINNQVSGTIRFQHTGTGATNIEIALPVTSTLSGSGPIVGSLHIYNTISQNTVVNRAIDYNPNTDKISVVWTPEDGNTEVVLIHYSYTIN